MKTLRPIILGAAAGILFALGARADGARLGTITRLDEAKGTIAILETQTGTTGSSTAAGAASAGAAQEFRLQDGLMYNALKEGDRISFTVVEKDGARTITRLEKQ